MGRKSSAKAETRESSAGAGTTPPEQPPRSSTSIVVAVIVALVAVVGGYAYVTTSKSGSSVAAANSGAVGDHQSTATPTEAQWAKFGPHKQASLPPLPTQPYAPPRPPDIVRAAYVFAAEHPEVLSYVPCFCGCERGGHRGNHDCFVAARNDKGDVTAWEPHGLECTVCLDVATEARQMFTSGASVRDIRAAVEKKWAGYNGGHTPTPNPPAKRGN